MAYLNEKIYVSARRDLPDRLGERWLSIHISGPMDVLGKTKAPLSEFLRVESKTCEACGESFFQSGGLEKYCTRECRDKMRAKRAPHVVVVCCCQHGGCAKTESAAKPAAKRKKVASARRR